MPVATSNIRHLSRMELPGGGQIVIQGSYAYVGHQNGPEGTTILDISDPRRPRIVSRLMVPNELTHTHKVRVVGDLMFTNSELQPGCTRRNEFVDAGFRIYDVKDPSNPRLLTFVRTHGKGVHRFDVDARYAYISTEMEGFVGNILVIYDIANPLKPVEVSRWWMPGQNVAGGETPHPKGAEHRLHHAMRCGDQLYAGCWASGVAIIDIKDISKPRTLSHYEYQPAFPEPTHTFLKVPFPIGGRSIALSTEEERPNRGPDADKPHAPQRTWDVTDPTTPKLLYTFELPDDASPYHGRKFRFGAHQLREIVDPDCLLFVTWFGAGLRILDITDPARPRERGYIIPKPGDGQKAPLANDVAKDDRGLIYLTDKACGLDVIELTS
ncbi:MAG: RNA polymerase subunit sigma-70 [Hyphomicrobiales bacterium]|nr:RNA polymerase subunit sigma-70 [Hyphomicrobiales bacterium]